MNARDIATILASDFFSKRAFCGVYPRDKLPRRVHTRKPCAYIINTDPAHRPGQHWVAVWFDGRGNAEYFDSYGLPPLHRDIKNFISRHSQKYIFNRRMLQAVTSSACGAYVLFFVLMKSRGASHARLLLPFRAFTNGWTNDRTVWRLISPMVRRSTQSPINDGYRTL
jgi:hypothetical protein